MRGLGFIGKFKLIAFGSSAGGFKLYKQLFSLLDVSFSLPIVITQHIDQNTDADFTEIFHELSYLDVKTGEDGEALKKGTIYFAPPNYHMLISEDLHIVLNTDELLHYSRPSIDMMFESVAGSIKQDAVGIILSGSNKDGAIGLKSISENGGYTIIQTIEDAEYSEMPSAALNLVTPTKMMNILEIADWLNNYE